MSGSSQPGSSRVVGERLISPACYRGWSSLLFLPPREGSLIISVILSAHMVSPLTVWLNGIAEGRSAAGTGRGEIDEREK